jgi:hypothetical protein
VNPVADEKVAGIWFTAPPTPATLLQPVNENTWAIAGFALSFTTMGGSTIPVPEPWPTHPIVTLAEVVLAGAVAPIA